MGKKMEKMTFSQELEALEEVVQTMEQDELSLEELMDEYAKGVTLLKSCREKLKAAEKRMEVLTGELGEAEDE